MDYTVLIIEDDIALSKTYRTILESNGCSVYCAHNHTEAIDIIHTADFDLIIADMVLEKPNAGIEILKEIRNLGNRSPYVFLTGHPEIQTATDAVRMGAFDYLLKPIDKKKLLSIVQKASDFYRLQKKNEHYRKNLETIFASMNEGILSVDLEMNILQKNDAAHKLCFLPIDSATTTFEKTSPLCSRKCVSALIETLQTKQPVRLNRIECKKIEADNQIVSVATSLFTDADSNKDGAVMIITDESRLVQLEDQQRVQSRYHRLVGSSNKMQRLFSLIDAISKNDSTVLITGESGTGKELVAEAIHKNGSRSHGPFITVNCSAIPETLFESELFGHIKGSFTGAITDKKGKFELAKNGTIFLDEIGEMPMNMQAKLLRVLQNKSIEKVGGSESIAVDFRVIAATNRTLEQMIQEETFRKDLFYRLRVFEICLDPLRNHKEDIPLLIKTFIEELSERFNSKVNSVSTEVLDIFMEYDWPGNVRELRSAIEFSICICKQTIITIDNLPTWIWKSDVHTNEIEEEINHQTVSSEEIMRALIECNGNKTEAAKKLKISRRTLYRKLSGIKF